MRRKKNWHGLLTWPPWVVIRASASNHKLTRNSWGVWSHFLWVDLTSGRRKKIELGTEKTTPWTITTQGLPNRRTNSKWPTDGSNYKRHNFTLKLPSICLSSFFLCQKFCAENFLIFFCEIKLLFALLKWEVVTGTGIAFLRRVALWRHPPAKRWRYLLAI